MHEDVRTFAALVGRLLAERWYRLRQENSGRASQTNYAQERGAVQGDLSIPPIDDRPSPAKE